MIGILALLYFQTQSYLNKNLSGYVSKKSKGKYELNFNNLEINFSQGGFEIKDVMLHPTDSLNGTMNDSIAGKRSYSFSSPNIRFSNIGLLKLIFRSQLEIGEILITRPELKIHGKHSAEKENNISTVLLELKPLVTKTFEYINIHKIELIDASFDFYNLWGDTRKLANAENITIGIQNFYTDSLLLPNPEKLFNADDIYLRMHRYLNVLGDSIHSLTAETVTYSLKRSQIEAEQLELKPVKEVNPEHARYYVSIPKVMVKSRLIHEFYKYKAIPVDTMILTDAEIRYYPGRKHSATTLNQIVEFDLYDLIEKEFSSVSISNFRLDNAHLLLYRNQIDTASQQELKNIRLSLQDFLLDSISLKDTSRIFYAKNIDFSVSEYDLTLGDNLHRLRAEKLGISTKRKSAFLRKIHLYPLQSQLAEAGTANTVDASCDSVRLDLLDFKRAYHTQRFYIHRVNLFNPQVQVTRNEVEQHEQDTTNASFVYRLISNYLEGIYADRVAVQKGKFVMVNKTGVLQSGLIETSFGLFLNGFALDETSARRSDRLFFANQIELRFNDYQMQLVDQLHKLTVENFSISTQKKQALLQNLHLFPVTTENVEDRLKQYNRSELYEFTIPELLFSNADFHHAFFNKKFSADQIIIQAPVIYYENFATLKPAKPKADFEDLYLLISNYLDDIHLGKVDIPDGKIRLVNHSRKGKTISLDNQFTLGLENLLINKDQFGKKRLLFSEQVEFAVRDHLIRLSDNVHVIKAGTVGFSTLRKEVYVTNARIYPETNSQNFPDIGWNIQLLIPEIRINGISVPDIYFDQKIEANNVLISSPEIKLYQKNISKEQADFKAITFPLPKEIETISMKQFNMNNATLKIFSELGLQPDLIVQSNLQMESRDVLIQKNASTSEPEFKSGRYTAALNQFIFTPREKNQLISIEEIKFSTAERHIVGRQLWVRPRERNAKQDRVEMYIPSFSMNGFNLDKAYREYQYFFESILVAKPQLTLYNNEKDSLRVNPFNVNLYPHFDSFADVFATRNLKVNDAGLTVVKNGQKIVQEKISFNLTNFRIDNKPSSGFLHSSDFAFSIQDIRRQDKKKLYQFTIGKTRYSSKNNRFTAIDLVVDPTLSKEAFNSKNRYQSDYYSGKIDSVVIDQPDIRRWFENGELAGRQMSALGLHLDIFRDKRLPFDDSKRPEMLQDLIKGLQHPIRIDSLRLVNSAINYIEHPPEGDKAGEIRFSNLDITLKPFTNMKGAGSNIPDFTIKGTANVLDSARMNVQMHYHMNHPDNLFTATGRAMPFDMQLLNPVLEPLAMVSIRSGKVNEFHFTMNGDRNEATGQLFFGYDDLRISVLELKDGNTKEARFASFLANSLLLRSKNPRGKELEADEISFQRDQKRSVVNYWWKSIFSGVRNTLGIKPSKENEENNRDQ
ncbi:MAG TPA: hypothetical protein VFG54_13185 [Prolixibacteraceae bacterium]|nr:hypothetical protein [Prolixibacteraceae bacterium]